MFHQLFTVETLQCSALALAVLSVGLNGYLFFRTHGPCGLRLRVELTKAGAATLDHAAILGLGHDREVT